MRAEEWGRYGIQGIVISSAIAYVFYKSVWAVAISWAFVIPYLSYKKMELKNKRLDQLRMQFKDSILALASLLAAGYSVENAMGKVAGEIRLIWGEKADMAYELDRMVNQLAVNRTAEYVWSEFAMRCGLEEAENFAGIFAIVKRSGGEISSVIQWAVLRMNQRFQTEEQIQTMIASKRYEQRLMNAMPIGILFYVSISSPDLLTVMYTTMAGRAIMTVCLAVYILAYLLAEKIVKIEV